MHGQNHIINVIVYSEMVVTSYNTAACQNPQGDKPYLSLAISTPRAARWKCWPTVFSTCAGNWISYTSVRRVPCHNYSRDIELRWRRQ